ncbi:MAG: hypothetical protein GEU73_03040 [Chloroflexi bacterium]|nr:hypothetical protein [Chloroflexota bacterium]
MRLVSVVIFDAAAQGRGRDGEKIELLVISEDLPNDPVERATYLARRMPPGSLEHVDVLLTTPEEFDADPPDRYRDIAQMGRILFDASGFAADRLAR